MSKHTPGPWQVWGVPGEIDLAVGPTVGGLAVAQVVTTNAHGFATKETTCRAAANAHLIAASPDMLAALQVTAGNIRSLYAAGHVVPHVYFEWQRVVEAAIFSAEGPE